MASWRIWPGWPKGAQSPSLIVVGEVAALADELGWFAGDVVTNPEHLVSLA